MSFLLSKIWSFKYWYIKRIGFPITEYVESKISYALQCQQAGFLIGKTCMHQFTTLRIIMGRINVIQKTLSIVFNDFWKAFDTINHLDRKGISNKICHLYAEKPTTSSWSLKGLWHGRPFHTPETHTTLNLAQRPETLDLQLPWR